MYLLTKEQAELWYGNNKIQKEREASRFYATNETEEENYWEKYRGSERERETETANFEGMEWNYLKISILICLKKEKHILQKF